MPRTWIGIGSNQDRERSIRGAVRALRERFGALVLSGVYESEAVGFKGQPFYNLVAGLDTDQPVGALHAALREIEDAFGRVRGPASLFPRTLDLDLLTYGGLTGAVDGCVLPREDVLRYAFVLRPLAEVAAEEVHPVLRRTYAELWRAFDQGLQPLVPVDLGLEP